MPSVPEAEPQSVPYAAPATASGARPTGSPWSPLGIALFRSLWIATLVSNIGTWAQEAGGPWLMRLMSPDLKAASFLVALVAVAQNLPIFLLSLPAGALADVLDRRKLLIFTQLWMLTASGLLGIFTLMGWTTPHLLLLFTFLLGIGIAMSGPAFQAIVPELVSRADMPLAVALNSVALNVARAIGPALGMLVVVAAGAGTRGPGASFLLNAASFVGVAWVLYVWERPPQGGPARAEQLWGAVHLGFHYTRHSPPMRAILLRVFVFIFCAVAMWSELPVIAKDQLHLAEGGYAVLMACLGAGAVAGVILMPELQRRLSIDGMVTACIAMFAVGIAILGLNTHPWIAYLVMLFIGFNWVIIPTNFNVATQKSVPNWVKGRALSMYLTTLFGSWAVGSFWWGFVARKSSISTALLCASGGLLLGLTLVRRFRLTLAAGHDLTPAFEGHATMALPAGMSEAGQSSGVTVEVIYHVPSARVPEFAAMMNDLRLQRLRNGATVWALEAGEPQHGSISHVERYAFASNGEWSRYHARQTRTDLAAQEAARAFHASADAPVVRYSPYAAPPGFAVRWRLSDHAYNAADRILEELEIVFDRFSKHRS